MTQGLRILSVGRVYCDLVFQSDELPQWGSEIFTEKLEALAGGGAFITAAYLNALGASASVAGAMGDQPPFDRVVQTDGAVCGLDLRHLRAGGGHQVTVALSGQKDRAFLTHKNSLPITVPDASDFDHIHVGELASLVECPELIDFARHHGATISCDCGFEPTYDPVARELLPMLDVFMPAEAEVNALEHQGIYLGELPHLVIKKGARGASARTNGVCTHGLAEKVEVLDTTGAGDAFNAGYLMGWLSGGIPARCLELGAKCGAAAIQTLGGWRGSRQLAVDKV